MSFILLLLFWSKKKIDRTKRQQIIECVTCWFGKKYIFKGIIQEKTSAAVFGV